MALAFELTEKQKEGMKFHYQVALSYPYCIRDTIKSPLAFTSHSISVKKQVLAEFFRRGYLAFRVKKVNTHFVCFIFEIKSPAKLRLDDGNVTIDGLDTVNVKPAISLMKEVIAGETQPKHVYRYVEDNVAYSFYPSQLQNETAQRCMENFGIWHTHLYRSAEPFAEILSAGDFTYLVRRNVTFLFASSINAAKFMQKVKKLDPSAFDKGGFLKLEHTKAIAKTLAQECIQSTYLKELSRNVGMPLVVAHRNEKNFIEIFTGLKIK